jgi:hypothetical protein
MINSRWERVQDVISRINRNEDYSPVVLSKMYRVSIDTSKSYIKDAQLFKDIVIPATQHKSFDFGWVVGILELIAMIFVFVMVWSILK